MICPVTQSDCPASKCKNDCILEKIEQDRNEETRRAGIIQLINFIRAHL